MSLQYLSHLSIYNAPSKYISVLKSCIQTVITENSAGKLLFLILISVISPNKFFHFELLFHMVFFYINFSSRYNSSVLISQFLLLLSIILLIITPCFLFFFLFSIILFIFFFFIVLIIIFVLFILIFLILLIILLLLVKFIIFLISEMFALLL